MLAATLLALAAAVVHAAWNLAVKQGGDRFIALWGQFSIAGTIGAIVLGAASLFAAFATSSSAESVGVPAAGWIWALTSGLIHVPYCWFLARAYDHGDFSLVYPMARGGGALIGAIGGITLLGDHLSALGCAAIAIVAGGLVMLSGPPRPVERLGSDVRAALIVAATIGAYSTVDAHGIRSSGTPLYAMASFVGIGLFTTAFGLVIGRRAVMVAAMQANWRRFAALGLASMVTYGMVQVAFQWAAVGYVSALRESSVVMAAFAGSRILGEPAGRRRIVASGVVLAGLILLVVSP